jgi:hypothetical protein
LAAEGRGGANRGKKKIIGERKESKSNIFKEEATTTRPKVKNLVTLFLTTTVSRSVKGAPGDIETHVNEKGDRRKYSEKGI